MFQGQIETQGSPSELSKSGIDFATLLQSDENSDSDNVSGKRSRTVSRVSRKSLTSLEDFPFIDGADETTNLDAEESKSVEQLQQLESSSKGQVHGSVSLAYLRSGANICMLLFIFILFIITQVLASGFDYFVSFWTSQEELRHFYKNQNQTAVEIDSHYIDSFMPNYNDTLSNSTKTKLLETRGDTDLLSTDTLMYIHGSIVGSLFVIALFRSMIFYNVCVHASQTLHDNMFKGIISTTMRFFDTNPSGRILNRFSKDMGAVDEFLPKAVLDASQIILSMGGAILVTAIVNPVFLAPVAVLGVIFIFVRKVYLKTAKNIKRIEGTSKQKWLNSTSIVLHTSLIFSAISCVHTFIGNPWRTVNYKSIQCPTNIN